MRQFSSIRIIRVTLALTVALWMAGAGCLLGCENYVAAASSNAGQTAEAPALGATGDACASARSASCCAKHGVKAATNANSAHHASPSHGAKPTHSTRTSRSTPPKESRPAGEVSASSRNGAFNASPSTMMDCPLAVNATAVLSKAKPDNANSALALTNVSQPLVNSPEQTTAFARPLRLPNRGHTYLRCCVFLI